jgi:hypothetical protein
MKTTTYRCLHCLHLEHQSASALAVAHYCPRVRRWVDLTVETPDVVADQ